MGARSLPSSPRYNTHTEYKKSHAPNLSGCKALRHARRQQLLVRRRDIAQRNGGLRRRCWLQDKQCAEVNRAAAQLVSNGVQEL